MTEYSGLTSEIRALAEAVLQTLKDTGKSVATAESCTGGLLSAAITSLSGASDVFRFGAATYGEEFKEKLLGVSKQTLACYTAVSAECAKEMARGIRDYAGADIGVSVTGYADTGDTPGLVFVGVCAKDECQATKFLFSPKSREFVRLSAAKEALLLLLSIVGDK
ncbi:MAG: nicotinamide-nucleotide amidohydrolase family protein [Oscillospiraceae bacterium]|jgi:nicotinamide-nucleotide amidase|nr:nicotinamide-nucleotide amidohydrolase family protein [Oscillospiraceae bacterium]